MSVCWCSRGVFFSENYVFGNGKICKIQQTKHYFVLLPSKEGFAWAISHIDMPYREIWGDLDHLWETYGVKKCS